MVRWGIKYWIEQNQKEEKKMIICVGREFGSGGHEIAKRLAQNLQIDFWDKELLDRAIEQSSLAGFLAAGGLG